VDQVGFYETLEVIEIYRSLLTHRPSSEVYDKF
jgi:hypothetical protein